MLVSRYHHTVIAIARVHIGIETGLRLANSVPANGYAYSSHAPGSQNLLLRHCLPAVKDTGERGLE